MIDPEQMAVGDRDWVLLSQDLLLLEHPASAFMIDVGWYPDESPSGEFALSVILDEDWQRPLHHFTTRSLGRLVLELETILVSPPEISTPRLLERLNDLRPETRGDSAAELARRNAFEAVDPIRDAMGREKDEPTIDRLQSAMHELIHERKRRAQ